MGWRWGSQESASLTFWFQLAWGLWFLSSDGDFSICKTAQRYCYVLPLRGNQVLHQGCTNVYWLLLPCICILSLPWLTTVLTCPLELREGHEDWSLFPVIKRRIGHKNFCAYEPCRVLLAFTEMSDNEGKAWLAHRIRTCAVGFLLEFHRQSFPSSKGL